MEDLEQNIAEAANDLLLALENALVHGWLDQEALDMGGLWRGDSVKRAKGDCGTTETGR